MQDEHKENLPLGVWLIILACTTVVILAFSAGAAYTGINQARLVAARASLGQIESTYYLADRAAADEGLKPPGDGADSLIQSYGSDGTPSAYDQFVLEAMLNAFGGDKRDFDFAISRYEDVTGVHTQILYFPVRGRTDTHSDKHYLLSDGSVIQNN